MRWILAQKKALVGLVAAGVVSSTVFAMAASLGGVTGASLGADSGSSASCDTDGVSTSYTTAYDATDARYEVSAVVVSGINNNCDGKTLALTAAQSGGAALSSGSIAIPSDPLTTQVTVTLAAAVSAESLSDLHVVIS